MRCRKRGIRFTGRLGYAGKCRRFMDNELKQQCLRDHRGERPPRQPPHPSTRLALRHPQREPSRQHGHHQCQHAMGELKTNAALERRHKPAPVKRPVGHREGGIVTGYQSAGSHQCQRARSGCERQAAQKLSLEREVLRLAILGADGDRLVLGLVFPVFMHHFDGIGPRR